MAEYLIQSETLTSIADAIRAKTGSTDLIAVADMAEQIEAIEGGGSVEVYDGTVHDEIPVTLAFSDGSIITDSNGLKITTSEV